MFWLADGGEDPVGQVLEGEVAGRGDRNPGHYLGNGFHAKVKLSRPAVRLRGAAGEKPV